MDPFTAPDGSFPEFLHADTILGLTMPRRRTAVLFATSDADWEQAALVYVRGYRVDRQLGNWERPVTMLLYAYEHPLQLLFTGWHKEGRPNSELPWVPSRGSSGPSFVAWKDKPAAAAPYNDLRIDIVIAPPLGVASPVRTARRAYQISELPYASPVGTSQRASNVAHLLTYLATLAETGRQTIGSGALESAPTLDEAIGRVIDEYLAEGALREPSSDSTADLLMADLLWRGHSIEAGSLRNRLVGLVQDVRRRAQARTRSTSG